MGIASSPSVGSAGAYPGRLVEIQQCAAEVEQRAEHEVGESERDALAVVALRVQQRDQGRRATPTTITSAASEPSACT